MSVAITQSRLLAPVVALRAHWQIYLADGALLGLFMVSACTFAAVLGHPYSPVSQMVSSPVLRRILGGLAMGLAAICLIYSPWGALMNPAMTLSFLRLGRIQFWDAVFYILSQFVVGSLAVALMAFAFSMWIKHPSVGYVATIPGPFGIAAAWLGEFIISAVLMTVVMAVNKVPRLTPYTGYFAGALLRSISPSSHQSPA